MLLANDGEWDTCLNEAAIFQGGHQLRHLFATIICNHDSANALALYNRHFASLSDDILRALQRDYGIPDPTPEQIQDVCLAFLQKVIKSIDARRDLQSFDLPIPSANATIPLTDVNELNDVNAELDRYNMQDLQLQVDEAEPLIALDEQQAAVVSTVLRCIQGPCSRVIWNYTID